MALPDLANLGLARQSVPRAPMPRPGVVTDETERSSQAPASHRPGLLSTALSMQDDLSALVSTLQRRRDSQGPGVERESVAWVDHILDDRVHEKLPQLIRLLPGMQSAADVLALLRRLFADPSDALAVLRALLADDELKQVHELLNDALERMLAESQGDGTVAQFKGGLNVAVKARLAAQGGGASARQLRHSYREFLASGGDCLGQYAAWIELYGFGRRAQVMDFMEQAVAADMYALDPSGGHLEFGRLLRRVRTLAVVRSADQALLRHCARHRLLPRLQASAEMVVGSFLDILRGLQDWSAMFSGPFAAARVVLNDAERGQWIQSLRRALHVLPDDLWPDEDVREQLQAELETLVAADVNRAILRGLVSFGEKA